MLLLRPISPQVFHRSISTSPPKNTHPSPPTVSQKYNAQTGVGRNLGPKPCLKTKQRISGEKAKNKRRGLRRRCTKRAQGNRQPISLVSRIAESNETENVDTERAERESRRESTTKCPAAQQGTDWKIMKQRRCIIADRLNLCFVRRLSSCFSRIFF